MEKNGIAFTLVFRTPMASDCVELARAALRDYSTIMRVEAAGTQSIRVTVDTIVSDRAEASRLLATVMKLIKDYVKALGPKREEMPVNR